jgi:hypothetical protein
MPVVVVDIGRLILERDDDGPGSPRWSIGSICSDRA